MDLERVVTHTPRSATSGKDEAAVLAPIVDRSGEPHLLFTKRADHLGEHAGQMSFPGGGREPSDESIRTTATREANEEIGIRSEEIEFVGRLDDILTASNYVVTPFVARVPDREYVPDEREVAEIAVLPVGGLCDGSNYENERRTHPQYGDIIVHFFHVNGYTVWGATARIVVQLLELTTDWRAPERIDRIVDTDPEL